MCILYFLEKNPSVLSFTKHAINLHNTNTVNVIQVKEPVKTKPGILHEDLKLDRNHNS